MAKLVCRVLGRDDRLLGWCAHEAVILGDGYLRASGPVSIDIDDDGYLVDLSIHWADVNVEVRVPMSQQAVTRGQSLCVFARHAPMIQAGEPPKKRLPPVSTKSVVRVAVPVGWIGATGVA